MSEVLPEVRHSFYEPPPNRSKPSKETKSDIDIVRSNDFSSIIASGRVNRMSLQIEKNNFEEYYKNYEHDDVPVKDDSCTTYEILSDDAATGDRKELTNSDLDKLEIRIYKNISAKELQTDDSSVKDLDNIQLFKTTIQTILDNFNSNMSDFEIFKQKFHDILSKTKENTVYEMEEFIKELIQHISRESCRASVSKESNILTFSEVETEVDNEVDSITFSHHNSNLPSNTTETTVEAYKNDNYFTDSTFDKGSSKTDRSEDKDNYNIYLANELVGCVGIKMGGRNVLSQINLRKKTQFEEPDQIASAENIKSIAAKKLQLKKSERNHEVRPTNDVVIPLKVSFARKNIHSEDVPDESEEGSQFFLFKLCNYLCRKLRKNAFG